MTEKDDEYRKQAADAQAMADKAFSDENRESWLRIAQSWLSLIKKPKWASSEETFEQEVKATDGGQERSKESH